MSFSLAKLGALAYQHRKQLASVLGGLMRRRGRSRRAAVKLYLLLARMNENTLPPEVLHAELVETLLELDPKGKAEQDAEQLIARLERL